MEEQQAVVVTSHGYNNRRREDRTRDRTKCWLALQLFQTMMFGSLLVAVFGYSWTTTCRRSSVPMNSVVSPKITAGTDPLTTTDDVSDSVPLQEDDERYYPSILSIARDRKNVVVRKRVLKGGKSSSSSSSSSSSKSKSPKRPSFSTSDDDDIAPSTMPSTSQVPSRVSTGVPSGQPSVSLLPSRVPTSSPEPTFAPTFHPTNVPTEALSLSPTTEDPTVSPEPTGDLIGYYSDDIIICHTGCCPC